jgi:ABC-type transport system involved in multi-copper enzyme maturation permease subunit
MKRLILLEWTKFRKNTVIQLLLLFFFLFFPACLYFGSLIPELPSFLPSKESFFQFPSIWEYLGYAGNWIVFFFVGVASIYLVTIEVSNKTLRQSIINGMTRNEFFISKLLSIVIFCLVATVYYAIMSLAIGFYNTEGFDLAAALDNDWAISRFFLMSFAYTNFALFLSFLFRKSGLAVFFYVSYIIIIEPLIRLLIIDSVDKASWTRYFPMNSAEDLMPLPAMKYASAIPSNVDFAFLLSDKEATILSLAYCAVFLGISYYLFLKKDI